MDAAERVLGPRWTAKELQLFYVLLRALGITTTSASISSMASVQWKKIEWKLPRRTPAMICALFGMNRDYLSKSEASVEGFCTVMADYYKAVDAAASRSDGTTGAALDIKMEVVEDESSEPRQPQRQQDDRDREMDAATRIRKRENSLTPTSAAADIANALAVLPSSSASSSVSTVKMDKKKRKLERILKWEAAGDQLELQAQLQLQIKSDDDEAAAVVRTMRSHASGSTACEVLIAPHVIRHLHGMYAFSSLCIATWLLKNIFYDSPHRVDRAHGCKTRRSLNCSQARASSCRGTTGSTRSWTAISSVTTNLSTVSTAWGLGMYVFVALCVSKLGGADITWRFLYQITAAARPVWSTVRASMGRPRRLSPRFFAQEKAKLESFRTVKRRIDLQHKVRNNISNTVIATLFTSD